VFFAVAAILLLAGGLGAQERAVGRALFGQNCSIPYCHGADGGEGRAPALRGRVWNESDLRRTIADGIPDTSMPPFGDRLSAEELDSLVTFILSISTGMESGSAEVRRGVGEAPWDLASGRSLFYEGRCAVCHRFGRDDLPGPDLNRASEKRPFEILKDILEPGAEVKAGKRFVRIETTGGENFSGIEEDDGEGYLRVHDLSSEPPALRRLRREDVSHIEPLSGSPMPSNLWPDLSAKQILDLVFFVRSGDKKEDTAPEVAARPVDIWSDGTRLSGKLFFPNGLTGLAPGEKLPAIVMSHGWGGLAQHLNEAYAPYFAAEGFVVLTFDYRGWGESDSRLVVVQDEVEAVREVVDPWDQIEDIVSALHFIEGEEIVDYERIGYILILDAGSEELFDIGEHGQKVYEIVKDRVAAKYHVFPGITHCDIYRGKRAEAIAMAIEWFRAHLGRPSASPAP
jgi:putative heme-binding domain-containing protein